MAVTFSEADYENVLISLFQNDLQYEYIYGPEIVRDYKIPYYEEILRESILRINQGTNTEAINEAFNKLTRIDSGTLIQKNNTFMNYVQNGIEVEYFYNGETKSTIVYLIDYKNVNNNVFQIANQWTYEELETKRADLIIFINGLPLVLMELKSPSSGDANINLAYNQIRNYIDKIPGMFIYNAICVISDMTFSKAGTISSNFDRFMDWKTIDGNYENTKYASYDTFFKGMFQKERLLDIIKNFICFSNDGAKLIKILAAYHQYFAVSKAIESTKRATVSDGRAGVFWHTQGSGKSLSMVFYAKLLQEALNSPTIVVITDRNDLDDQLYGQFAKCQDFLRQTPVHAESRKHLRELLDGRQANGIFFTTMQKFEESDEPLSTRHNIIVMADEAHRSQYGLTERVDREGNIHTGTARIIRNSLPNASFIGFTGTPISQKDRNTTEVFGNYIDIYDMTQAVEDGATRPVYYESRVVHLGLDENVLKQIDDEYDLLEARTDATSVDIYKKKLGRLEAVLGADQTINSLVDDILKHYESNRQDYLTGKAMIVAYSREIGIKIYKRILELRPDWTEKVKVVMTSSNKDPEEWHEIIGTKAYKNQLAIDFKNNESPLKIAIVVDMWLTGFDVPSLATMYVYKPMSGHNLMQAIARVNRVFGDKEGGLIVDYIGIAKALKNAMKDYTSRDQNQYGNPNIAEVAYPKFLEKLDVCQNLFFGFDYNGFLIDEPARRAEAITGGINFMLDPNREEILDNFIKEAYALKQSLSLCSSMASKEERLEASYFEVVRVGINKIKTGIKPPNRIFDEKINELLKQSIKSEGVINIFDDSDKIEFSLFDEKFLQDVANMKHKNLAIEMLKKILNDQIVVYQRTNVVKAEKFSEMLKKCMNSYVNGMKSSIEIIEELLKYAKDIQLAYQAGQSLGLTTEELAFYDALTKPQAIKDFYTNEQLIGITKELTESLRNNKTIDWQKKESARAKMRRSIKHLLKKYKYPPEGMEDALNTVMLQCELWTDNAVM